MDAGIQKWKIERQRMRERLWNLSGQTCFYCGLSFPLDSITIDHLVPRVKGVHTERIPNFVPACLRCNNEKDCRMPTSDEIKKATVLHLNPDEYARTYLLEPMAFI